MRIGCYNFRSPLFHPCLFKNHRIYWKYAINYILFLNLFCNRWLNLHAFPFLVDMRFILTCETCS